MHTKTDRRRESGKRIRSYIKRNSKKRRRDRQPRITKSGTLGKIQLFRNKVIVIQNHKLFPSSSLPPSEFIDEVLKQVSPSSAAGMDRDGVIIVHPQDVQLLMWSFSYNLVKTRHAVEFQPA